MCSAGVMKILGGFLEFLLELLERRGSRKNVAVTFKKKYLVSENSETEKTLFRKINSTDFTIVLRT